MDKDFVSMVLYIISTPVLVVIKVDGILITYHQILTIKFRFQLIGTKKQLMRFSIQKDDRKVTTTRITILVNKGVITPMVVVPLVVAQTISTTPNHLTA